MKEDVVSIAHTKTTQLYADEILGQIPRVLSLMDREKNSVTAGCCDRTYWAWKFVDFPGARFQESLCVLGFVWATDLPENTYKENEPLLDWISEGLRYWCSIQYKDGSFDEAYPYERSLAATAFTSFYICEAIGFLKGALPNKILSAVTQSLDRAGEWLARHDETHGFLSNHLAAASAALCHISRITGKEKYQVRSEYFLQKILDHQSSEGWYEEYEAADPGYQTHGSFYLVRNWQITGNETLKKSLSQSMRWLAHFVHPDGSLGGEYASRNTQTYYPAAFELFRSEDPSSAWIAQTMRPSVKSGAAAGLRNVDIYNFFPLLNNLVFAYIGVSKTEVDLYGLEEPDGDNGLRWYPKAGLARVRTPKYDAIIGTAKGGVVKVFDRGQKSLVYSDCGYVGRLRNGKTVSSQYLDSQRSVSVTATEIKVEGGFCEVSRPVLDPYRFIAFRSFMVTLGRFPSLARWIKSYIVRLLIYRKYQVPIQFKRSVFFKDDEVIVRDMLSGEVAQNLEFLKWEEIFTTIHMGSSKYFITNELNRKSFRSSLNASTIDLSKLSRGVEITRQVEL